MMMQRSGVRLHVHTAVVTRVFPYLRRTIFGGPAEEGLPSPFLASAESCSDAEEAETSVSQLHQPQVLHAYLRNGRSRCVARVREQGLVPAVLVHSDRDRCPPKDGTDVLLTLDAKPLAGLIKLIGKRDFTSRIFDMNIYCSSQSMELKESVQVLPRCLNYGPGKTNILNVQFMRATPGQIMKLGVPLEYLGAEQCPGLKKGGTLRKFAKYVVYNCKAAEMTAKIVVDMSVLEIGDRVQVQDLEVNFDHLYSDKTMPVCEIVKDINSLKAKATRLKNEIYFKKRALAENESYSQSHSLSEDEVDANFREQSSSRFQRQQAATKDLASESSTSRVFGLKNKGNAYGRSLHSLSYDVSVDKDEGLFARIQRHRDAQTMLPLKDFISRRTCSIMEGEACEQSLTSLSDEEVDVSDDEDEEASTRFQVDWKELLVKDSLSRVSGSLENGKTWKPRLCSLSDDEVDVPKELLSSYSINKVVGSLKKGKVFELKVRSLWDDEGDDNKGEDSSIQSGRQRGAHTELYEKNSINGVSGFSTKGGI